MPKAISQVLSNIIPKGKKCAGCRYAKQADGGIQVYCKMLNEQSEDGKKLCEINL